MNMYRQGGLLHSDKGGVNHDYYVFVQDFTSTIQFTVYCQAWLIAGWNKFLKL